VDADELNPLDYDHNGWLSDDERDEDADGLTNWAELHGYSTPDWWRSIYSRENPYLITYAGTSATDNDSDGDGVLDGADDQDHDDYPNLVEQSRVAISSPPHGFDPPKLDKALASNDPSVADPRGGSYPDISYGRVQPFNPCLPWAGSRTCPTRHPVDKPYAPYDGLPWDTQGDDPNYLVLN
jgi:hypothetical protein